MNSGALVELAFPRSRKNSCVTNRSAPGADGFWFADLQHSVMNPSSTFALRSRGKQRNEMRFARTATFLCFLLTSALDPAVSADVTGKPDIPVLVYHQISTPEHPLALKSDVVEFSQFSEQMEFLHANGYQSISTRQLVDFMLHGSPVPERAFVLHFDDGWKSVKAVLPILERYNFKATFWIIAGKGIGGDYLDWDDIAALSRNPRYEVYSHTMTHPWDTRSNLVTWEQGKVPGKGIADIDWELRESKRILEARLGKPVPYLAWPIGAYNDALISAAVRAGYSALFTIDWGRNEVSGDVLRVRRDQISGFTCEIADFSAGIEDRPFRVCEQQRLEKHDPP
jgi:peptidoglycan/xylan/chitin deacetylase (PgdA/CDA1 family)